VYSVKLTSSLGGDMSLGVIFAWNPDVASAKATWTPFYVILTEEVIKTSLDLD
jgi:hypothetical protein